MSQFCITTEPQTPEAAAQLMAELCELVVVDNLAWLQAQKALGYEVPCCAKCGGVRYVPPTASQYRLADVRIDGAKRLLSLGRGACGSIAAYDVAALRLEGERAWVEIVDQGSGYYHAIVGHPNGTFTDPTAEMQEGSDCACSQA